MSEVRLIDANALEKLAIPCETHNGALTELCVPLYQIRNAPTLPNPCGNPCNFTRPTGKWIESEIGHHCSRCGMYGWFEYNFCPKCGARMEEAEDE